MQEPARLATASVAPKLSTALERAAAAGYTHLNLDSTVIRTDRVAAVGPRSAPGREHDTTCARAHGLVDALNRLAAALGIPTPARPRLRERRRWLAPPGQQAQGR